MLLKEAILLVAAITFLRSLPVTGYATPSRVRKEIQPDPLAHWKDEIPGVPVPAQTESEIDHEDYSEMASEGEISPEALDVPNWSYAQIIETLQAEDGFYMRPHLQSDGIVQFVCEPIPEDPEAVINRFREEYYLLVGRRYDQTLQEFVLPRHFWPQSTQRLTPFAAAAHDQDATRGASMEMVDPWTVKQVDFEEIKAELGLSGLNYHAHRLRVDGRVITQVLPFPLERSYKDVWEDEYPLIHGAEYDRGTGNYNIRSSMMPKAIDYARTHGLLATGSPILHSALISDVRPGRAPQNRGKAVFPEVAYLHDLTGQAMDVAGKSWLLDSPYQAGESTMDPKFQDWTDFTSTGMHSAKDHDQPLDLRLPTSYRYQQALCQMYPKMTMGTTNQMLVEMTSTPTTEEELQQATQNMAQNLGRIQSDPVDGHQTVDVNGTFQPLEMIQFGAKVSEVGPTYAVSMDLDSGEEADDEAEGEYVYCTWACSGKVKHDDLFTEERYRAIKQ